MGTPLTICTVLGCLFAFADAGAQESRSPDPIRPALQKLASKRYRDRHDAAVILEAIGQSAVPALKEATLSSDAEVREQADTILRRIDSQARNQALGQPPKLRLKFLNTPIKAAVSQVAKLTQLPLVLDEKLVRNNAVLISLDTGEVDFWEAVEKFLEVAGLTENPNPEPAKSNENVNRQFYSQPNGVWIPRNQMSIVQPDNKIHLMSGKTIAVCADKIVRVKAVPKEMGSFVRGSDEIEFMLDVTPAPSAGWQSVSRLDIRLALDDQNRVLKQSHVSGDGGPMENGMEDGTMAFNGQMVFTSHSMSSGGTTASINPNHFPVKLLAANGRSKYLKELQGVISAQMLAPVDVLLEIDLQNKSNVNKSFHVDGYDLTIAEVSTSNKGTQVRVKLAAPFFFPQLAIGGRFRPAQPFLALQQNVAVDTGMSPTFELQDGSGKMVKGVLQEFMGQEVSPNGMSSEFLLAVHSKTKGTTPPTKLLLKGRRSIEVEIPFKIKNVPLPQ